MTVAEQAKSMIVFPQILFRLEKPPDYVLQPPQDIYCQKKKPESLEEQAALMRFVLPEFLNHICGEFPMDCRQIQQDWCCQNLS